MASNKVRLSKTDYEALICKELAQAAVVPYMKVKVEDWIPTASSCHGNVDAWVLAHAGHSAVRGWVFCRQCIIGDSLGSMLTAHSVVRDEKGYLFDITPLQDERQRPSMWFIPHFGDEQSFQEFESSDRFISCPVIPGDETSI